MPWDDEALIQEILDEVAELTARYQPCKQLSLEEEYVSRQLEMRARNQRDYYYRHREEINAKRRLKHPRKKYCWCPNGGHTHASCPNNPANVGPSGILHVPEVKLRPGLRGLPRTCGFCKKVARHNARGCPERRSLESGS